VLCGVDARAGGTWLGVNEHGVVAAVTNRLKPRPETGPPTPQTVEGAAPVVPRSRGLLCRELLNFRRAAEAARFAREQLASGVYDGANFVCLDAHYGVVIHAGTDIQTIELPRGLHLLTTGDLNDPADARQVLARQLFAEGAWSTPRQFVEAAQQVCSRGPRGGSPGIVVRGDGRGTVSSTILTVGRHGDESFYYFAAGAPDEAGYQDCGQLIRNIFSPTGVEVAAAGAARGHSP
jgi:hypothetical protein